MSEEKSFVIVFILVLIVIVIVIFAASGWFSQIYAGIRGTTLDPETKEKMEDNFDSLVKNIEECSRIKDYHCFCSVMPAFPGSFVKNINLKLYTEGKTLKMELMYKNKKIREAKIDNFNIQTISLTTNLITQKNFVYQFILEFTKKFPFEKNTKQFIASEKIYKQSNEDAFFLTTKKQEDAETINQELEKFPQCLDNRAEAVKVFMELTDLLKAKSTQDYIALLPEGYTIECNKNEMLLMHNNEKVKKITIKVIQNKKIETALEVDFVKFEKANLLCSQDQMTIKPNQKVKIKGGCIE